MDLLPESKCFSDAAAGCCSPISEEACNVCRNELSSSKSNYMLGLFDATGSAIVKMTRRFLAHSVTDMRKPQP